MTHAKAASWAIAMTTFASRVLGGFSAVDGRLGRLRILGLVPANWLFMALMGVGFVVFAVEIAATARDSKTPESVPIDVLLGGGRRANRHVEVIGTLFPETHVAFPIVRKGIERPAPFIFVGMLAPSGKVLLVRFPAVLGHGRPRTASVSGLLVPPERSLSLVMQRREWILGGAPVDSRFVLIEGMTPKPLWLLTLIALAFALPVIGLLASRLPRAASCPQSPPPDPALERS